MDPKSRHRRCWEMPPGSPRTNKLRRLLRRPAPHIGSMRLCCFQHPSRRLANRKGEERLSAALIHGVLGLQSASLRPTCTQSSQRTARTVRNTYHAQPLTHTHTHTHTRARHASSQMTPPAPACWTCRSPAVPANIHRTSLPQPSPNKTNTEVTCVIENTAACHQKTMPRSKFHRSTQVPEAFKVFKPLQKAAKKYRQKTHRNQSKKAPGWKNGN